MEAESLKTASTYVNNLLLSRGLLRDGHPIDFSKPVDKEGRNSGTMAKVINLVHDLVLRRDRESDTLTTLSQNLTTLRTASAQQSQTITRLESKAADLERQLAFAVSQERSAKSGLQTAESRNKALRDDMGRLKSTVSQIRAQCANDLRKRDAEIQRLKKHLEVRRGREGSAQIGVTVVTPGITKPKNAILNTIGTADLDSPAYSLKDETAEFLTQLSQDLSNENDALISLVQNTLATLHHLQGLPSPSSSVSAQAQPLSDPNVESTAPPSYEFIATSMDQVLEHLRRLLTNPNFVPLEEVEIREEEILRLREGWDKMESRWHEAIALMSSWRQRMMDSGDTINLDDLRKGLNLNRDPIPQPQSSAKNHQGYKKRRISNDADESVLSTSSVPESRRKQMEADLEKDDISPPPKLDLGVGLFPAPKALRPTNANPQKKGVQANSPKIAALMRSIDDEDELALLDFADNGSRKRRYSQEEDEEEANDNENQEPSLTIAQKLKKAEDDAQAARKAAAAVAVKTIASPQKKPVKRTAIPKKIRSKRRSTLSPEELEGLMGV